MPFSVGAREGVVEAMRESTGGSAADSGGTEGALATMSTAFFGTANSSTAEI